MNRKPDQTPEEALAIVLKRREKRREYQRKIYAGYLAAKKAGLI